MCALCGMCPQHFGRSSVSCTCCFLTSRIYDLFSSLPGICCTLLVAQILAELSQDRDGDVKLLAEGAGA